MVPPLTRQLAKEVTARVHHNLAMWSLSVDGTDCFQQEKKKTQNKQTEHTERYTSEWRRSNFARVFPAAARCCLAVVHHNVVRWFNQGTGHSSKMLQPVTEQGNKGTDVNRCRETFLFFTSLQQFQAKAETHTENVQQVVTRIALDEGRWCRKQLVPSVGKSCRVGDAVFPS